ncbi:MAG: nucleotide pyrophosphohydrolase [Acidobacteriota bacterium]|nr:nucleotide pyrophosphohydrolase [Acidobacteriota bacterium]
MPDLAESIQQILKFRDERNWKQFHSVKNLSTAIAIEAAELQEIFLWRTDEEIKFKLDGELEIKKVAAEIADILIFCLLFCDAVQIDPLQAINDKLSENAKKYPVELSRSRADKYTELK